MKLLKALLVALFMLLVGSTELAAQVVVTSKDASLYKRFSVGENYYASNFKGMKMLMSDLQASNVDLYNKMYPFFNTIRHKSRSARAILISSGLVSGVMFVGGLSFWQKDDNVGSDVVSDEFFTSHSTSKGWNEGLVFGAVGVMLAGAAIAYLVAPDETDYYNFINRFNESSPDKKMHWDFGISANQQSVGLSLALTF